MQVRSVAQLKYALLSRLGPAVQIMAQQVEQQVDESVMTYYTEFDRKRYETTGTMSQTPMHEFLGSGGDSAEARVYLNEGFEYNTGTWSMSNVLDSAENSLHGGYPGGHPLWSDPMNEVKGQERSMWLSALTAAGLPVH